MTEAVVAAAAMAGALATDDYEHGYNAHDPDDLAMITQADPSMPLIGMSSREGRRQLHKLLPTTRYYREEEAEKKVRDAGWFDTTLRGVNLDSNARGPSDHESFKRGAVAPIRPGCAADELILPGDWMRLRGRIDPSMFPCTSATRRRPAREHEHARQLSPALPSGV